MLAAITFLLASTSIVTTFAPGSASSVLSPPKNVNVPKDEVWTCAEVRFDVHDVHGSIPKFEHFSPSASGITFTDPDDSKGSGACNFSGVQKKYHVGDKVSISMNTVKMQLTCWCTDVADGKKFFHRGITDPFTPPHDTLNFSFTFEPPQGAGSAIISMEASPTMSKNYSGWSGHTIWVFTPGDKPTTGFDLKISDVMKTGGDVSYLTQGGDIADINKLFKDATQVDGVAADGVSALLVTASSDSPGDVSFTVDGAGGALYPIKSGKPIFKQEGGTMCGATMKKVGDGYGAVALYRPPSYFGRGENPKHVTFHVRGKDGQDHSHTINLVRPPVVLVHGTYDNPSFCYEEHDPADDSPVAMAPMLRSLGYDVSCVDWKETNGDKDPSDFQTNRLTVWRNPGGIKDALKAMRDKNIAVTQADVVCHSQGGVIARTYIRGFPFSVSMPPGSKHFTNPDHCKIGDTDCWYHREDNFYLGDIHRLVTISSTHRGSHVCNVFPALEKYSDSTAASKLDSLFTNIFLVGVDKMVTGITTGGFFNQIPDSLELQLIGPSPVPAHAIACTATDQDMKTVRVNNRFGVTQAMGDYYGKLYLIFSKTSDVAKAYAFNQLTAKAQANNVPNAAELSKAYFQTLATLRKYMKEEIVGDEDWNDPATLKALDDHIYSIRHLVFEGDQNDCTVAMHSSWGLLKAPYVTNCEHVLHGWAPRYRNVQNKVIQLLVDDGSLFDPNGFPGFSGLQSQASSFMTVIRPSADNSPIPGVNAGSGNTGSTTLPGNPPTGGKTGGTTVTDPKTGGTLTSNGPPPGGMPPLTISPSTWSVPSSPLSGGQVSFDGGAMNMTLGSSDTGKAQGFAKSVLAGDFDVSFDIDVPAPASAEGLRLVSLAFRTDPADEDGQVEFCREDNVGHLSFRFSTPDSESTSKPTTDAKARIRVKRVGNKWSSYAMANGSWQLVGEGTGPVEPMHPGFVMQRRGPAREMTATIRPSNGKG